MIEPLSLQGATHAIDGLPDLGPPTPKGCRFHEVVRGLLVENESFAYASVAIATALDRRRRVVIAQSDTLTPPHTNTRTFGRAILSPLGIRVIPVSIARPVDIHSVLPADGAEGDLLLICDPSGDQEELLWDAVLARQAKAITIAITGSHPSFLAAQAAHAIQLPLAPHRHSETTTAIINHLMEAATRARSANRRRRFPWFDEPD